MFAELAASVAAEAADIAEPIAEEAASVEGVVTTVVEVDGVVVVVAGGVVVVVVVSSFLLHAANETAAARVTISSAVFMFLLDIEVRLSPVSVGTLVEEPHGSERHGKPSASSA
jgi:hypothetical protein